MKLNVLILYFEREFPLCENISTNHNRDSRKQRQ